MTAPRFYSWPPGAWLLAGVPMSVLVAGLDLLAVNRWHWWSDASGWTAGVAVMLGACLGCAIWLGLMEWSWRRQR